MSIPTIETCFEEQDAVLARAELFRATLEAYYAEEDARLGNSKWKVTKFTLEVGPKNIRVVQSEITPITGKALPHRSVYCFIDRSNGDLLKAAGWKTPAKGKRGSIFNENCDVGTRADMHGSGLYLR